MISRLCKPRHTMTSKVIAYQGLKQNQFIFLIQDQLYLFNACAMHMIWKDKWKIKLIDGSNQVVTEIQKIRVRV